MLFIFRQKRQEQVKERSLLEEIIWVVLHLFCNEGKSEISILLHLFHKHVHHFPCGSLAFVQSDEVNVGASHQCAAKREEQARQDRYQGVLDRFISEGHEQLKAFSQSGRIDFNAKEVNAVYYGIMATATKSNIALRSPQEAEPAVDRFLANMDWDGCGNYRKECVAHWTKLFATDEVVYTEPIIQNFLSFINHMSCSADTYVSLGGSNGCADQPINWDGTQKVGLGTLSKKKAQGLSR